MANLNNAAKAGLEAGLDEVAQVFKDNIDSRQSQFDALKAITIKQRKYLGFGPDPILIASGTLQKHLADERSGVTVSGSVATGTIAPSKSATPEYGNQPISEYAGALNKVREFWDINGPGDIDRVKQAIMKAFVQEFNRNG